MGRSIASALTLSATNLLFRSFLKLGTKSVKVNGLPILLEALEEGNLADVKGKGKERPTDVSVDGEEVKRRRRGIVTVANHNSVVDDPLAWTIMPMSSFFPLASPTTTSRNTRWTLGARDIMFTNPFLRRFFSWGQVIDTERGGGIFQPAVDQAVKLLQDGEWIHIFPEGKVNQRKTNPEGGLIRFKWGIGRIVMDSETMPEIIPMWLSGFDQVMPETRGFPRIFPRTGANLSVTFGQPLTSRIAPLVEEWRAIADKEKGTVGIGGEWAQQGDSPIGDEQRDIRGSGRLAGGEEEAVRIRITEALQAGLRELGEDVERKEGRFERGDWSHSTAGVWKRE